jgi:hypothetical protein
LRLLRLDQMPKLSSGREKTKTSNACSLPSLLAAHRFGRTVLKLWQDLIPDARRK